MLRTLAPTLQRGSVCIDALASRFAEQSLILSFVLRDARASLYALATLTSFPTLERGNESTSEVLKTSEVFETSRLSVFWLSYFITTL